MFNFQCSIPGLMELQSPGSDGLPTVLKLANHSASDSQWTGISSIGPITEDGDPMDVPAASARMEFAPTSDGKYPLFALSTLTPALPDGEGTIVIEGDGANWLFTVPPQVLPLPAGLWYWTFRVTDTSAATRLIYRGTIIITV